MSCTSLLTLTYKQILLCFIMVCALISPSDSAAIVVSIQNDLQKAKEGKILEIDHITTQDAPKSRFRVIIYPNETKTLAAGSITRFIVSRVFPSHKLKYEVHCIDSEDTAVMSLQEVHDDNMGDNCRLFRFGHWSRRSGTNWTYLNQELAEAQKKEEEAQDGFQTFSELAAKEKAE